MNMDKMTLQDCLDMYDMDKTRFVLEDGRITSMKKRINPTHRPKHWDLLKQLLKKLFLCSF